MFKVCTFFSKNPYTTSYTAFPFLTKVGKFVMLIKHTTMVLEATKLSKVIGDATRTHCAPVIGVIYK